MSLRRVLGVKEEFITDSNQAVEFKMIRHANDLSNDSGVFKPDMSHQIFGDDEQIYGYENLLIKLYYSAANLTTYLGVEYKDRLDDAVPANIEKTLADKYECSNFITNIDEFGRILEKEKNFNPFGELLNSFTINDNDSFRTFCVYKCTTDSKEFLEYHAKMQTFVLWFIDAASFINTEDSYWKFYVMYEKYKSADNTPQYAFVGYFTVYEFYFYPDKIRPRISQALILPPFQGMGLCAKLINTVQMHYASMREVFDITVEDPAIDFQRVRDYVDCSNCLHLSSFSSEKLIRGFHSDMAEEAREKYKINKKQARRIYEILRLNITNIHNEAEYKEYRLDVKKRLYAPFQRQNSILIKTNQAHLIENKEERLTKLQELFNELSEEYTKVLDRVLEYPLNS
ncbi:histone acetyltransferase type B catalytic subunit-like [Cimex lectularius]|uniref:Histone acetyltransferase type B catalytic subunit n=1 Tax=Cimex lectularius TaxID=79782 RepID=A0A8I6RF88_CIMLE|nr:histone acetyltransferase type B catalytic subunit-like [Cimex lectularius]